jgi:hypothetical protein
MTRQREYGCNVTAVTRFLLPMINPYRTSLFRLRVEWFRAQVPGIYNVGARRDLCREISAAGTNKGNGGGEIVR